MALTIALIALGALAVTFIVLVAKEKNPSPEETAVAYERAWDRFDFATIWELSGPELRDGRDRKTFVEAKRAAYVSQEELRGLVRSVTATAVEATPESAMVVTTITTVDDEIVRNQCTLTRRGGRWFVISYTHVDPVGEPQSR